MANSCTYMYRPHQNLSSVPNLMMMRLSLRPSPQEGNTTPRAVLTPSCVLNGVVVCCHAFPQQLCVRGLTVVVASGDAGATGNGHGGESCKIAPEYPASSPWVTSVGATYITDAAPARRAGVPGEAVVNLPGGLMWTSGGGFSNAQMMPWYQTTAVAGYLEVILMLSLASVAPIRVAHRMTVTMAV